MRATPKKVGSTAAPGSRFLSEVVAENVRVLRAQRRLSQTALATQMTELGHGWSRATVSDVERSGRNVTIDEAMALAVVLATTPPDLLDPAGIDGRNTAGLDVGAKEPLLVKVASEWLRGGGFVITPSPNGFQLEPTSSYGQAPETGADLWDRLTSSPEEVPATPTKKAPRKKATPKSGGRKS